MQVFGSALSFHDCSPRAKPSERERPWPGLVRNINRARYTPTGGVGPVADDAAIPSLIGWQTMAIGAVAESGCVGVSRSHRNPEVPRTRCISTLEPILAVACHQDSRERIDGFEGCIRGGGRSRFISFVGKPAVARAGNHGTFFAVRENQPRILDLEALGMLTI